MLILKAWSGGRKCRRVEVCSRKEKQRVQSWEHVCGVHEVTRRPVGQNQSEFNNKRNQKNHMVKDLEGCGEELGLN